MYLIYMFPLYVVIAILSILASEKQYVSNAVYLFVNQSTVQLKANYSGDQQSQTHSVLNLVLTIYNILL